MQRTKPEIASLTCRDSDEEYGIEMLVLENGTFKTFVSRYYWEQKQDFDTNSPVWCDTMLYPSKDGFLTEMEELSEEEMAEIEEDKECGEFTIGTPHEAWKEHHDAGNEGGGHTTWYRSACIISTPPPRT